MTCDECLRWIAKYGDRGPEAHAASVREHLDGCARCQARLRALRLLEEGRDLHVEPPSGLAATVAARAVSAEPERRHGRLVLHWAPVAAAAIVALVVTVALVSRHPGSRAAETGVVKVHLSLVAPAAREVDVVGDWNDWTPGAQPLERRDGRWDIVLELQRGRCYQYQFLIDGNRWIPDPSGLARVDNGFGGQNSLLGS